MLTKTDLSQIRKIIREEVEAEVKDSTQTLGTTIRESRMKVQYDINQLDDRIKNVEIRLDNSDKNTQTVVSQLDKISGKINSMEKDMKNVKKTLGYVKKTTEILVDRTDREETSLGKRIKRIEGHLNLPPGN